MSELTKKLSQMDFRARAKRLRDTLAEEQLDAMLVTDLLDIRWLTGFTGSAGRLIVTDSKAIFVTDARYDGQAQQEIEVSGAEVEIRIENAKQKEVILSALKKHKRIGLEAQHITWETYRAFEAEWFDAETELVPTVGLIDNLRREKDAGEIDRIKRASHIADMALEKVRPYLEECPTEKQVARELESAMFDLGAEAVSFETIVAVGKHSAWAHARPETTRSIEKDQLILIDMGALVDGYHSDMTRTMALTDPGEVPCQIYDVVEAAQAAGVEKIKAGVSCSEIDKACREIIDAAGYGDSFTHSTGHGVGLNIHELPRVTATSDDVLIPGDIITVEPGIYLESHGGVRIEDTCLVTETGYEILTLSPKALL